MENRNETFEYTYSAARQEEIEKIRRKYLPQGEADKMELLRKMDRDTTKSGTIWSIIVGVIGCLLFGVGMCCCLVWADTLLVTGIVVGILGMVLMVLALPIYGRITASNRKKIAAQILALSDELLK